MKEARDLVRAWRSLEVESKAVLATVVATSGSTYRRPGARMLIADGEWLAGSLSGGCLEADVLSTAWERTENGPVVVQYDASADEDIIWGFGLGCNGIVQVLLERVNKDCLPLQVLEQSAKERKRFILATTIQGDEIGNHQLLSQMPEKPNNRVFYETIVPPRQLVIFGKTHDVAAVAKTAEALGWDVTLIDPKQCESPLRYETQTAVVIMSHNYLQDQRLLKETLGSQAGYIGLLGPRRRAERMLRELQMPFDERLHAPIGLNIGAEGPEQIALAIIAEIQAWFAGRAAGFLRDAETPIHQCNRSA